MTAGTVLVPCMISLVGATLPLLVPAVMLLVTGGPPSTPVATARAPCGRHHAGELALVVAAGLALIAHDDPRTYATPTSSGGTSDVVTVAESLLCLGLLSLAAMAAWYMASPPAYDRRVREDFDSDAPSAPAPMLRAAGLTMTYPAGATASRADRRRPRGLRRAGRRQRRRQDDPLPADARTHAADGRLARGGGGGVAADPVGVRSRLGYMPEHDCLPLDQTASDIVATFGELAGLPPRPPASGPPTCSTWPGSTRPASAPWAASRPGCASALGLPRLLGRPRAGAARRAHRRARPRGPGGHARPGQRLAGFGISVLLATHLLDDVQRVCDHVVMIDRGHLVLAGPIDQLMQTTGLMRVEWAAGLGRPGGAGAALAERGLEAEAVDDHNLDVDTSGHDEAVFDVVRDTVADLDLRLYLSTSPLARRRVPPGGRPVTALPPP